MPRFVQQCIRTVEARGMYACADKAAPRDRLLGSRGWRHPPRGEHKVNKKKEPERP